MNTEPYTFMVHSVLSQTAVDELLAKHEAVILERIAMGGGATKWYYCSDRARLSAVEPLFLPGSVVSFYFDGRIRRDVYSDRVRTSVMKIVTEEGESIIGSLAKDGLHISVDIVSGPNDLADFEASIGHDVEVFYGAFPSRENDGVGAITIALPDTDGVVRSHPH